MSVVTHEGDTIAVGSLLYLPVKVTAIPAGVGGFVTVTTGYSNVTLTGVPGPDTHTGQPVSWPSMP